MREPFDLKTRDGVIEVIDQWIKWQYKNRSEASLITAAYGSHCNKEEPSFNWNNQEPDLKSAVEIWNIKYANGKTILYKVSIWI